MSEQDKINRRRFIGTGLAGAGLLAAGGALGWLAGRRRPVAAGTAGAQPPLDPRFTYDVSAYERTDPALVLYQEQSRIPTGFKEPKCLTVGAEDQIYVGGDRALRIFRANGEPLTSIALAGLPHAVEVTADERIVVGLQDRLEAFDAAGALRAAGESLGRRAHITAIAAAGDWLFVADAGNREVVRCDRQGKVLSRFGRLGAGDGSPGFVVPSPYFDLLHGPEGLLWVANPGRHRVEAYTLEGQYELDWGQTAMTIEGFCGCCNPVYLARLRDGRFVTSEKGLNRIKIYDQQGGFVGVVAGPEHLVEDLDLARKACANCQIGFGFDIACDNQGRVLALDPATKQIRIFVPRAGREVTVKS